ncbi:MAG: hypothetical protein HOG95_13010 [Rhodospirillaceae bacterium]|nr:hypothetical protein [Rhodospirillaceae bacterium]
MVQDVNPGTILMSAQLRLLPPSLTFRFFMAAAVFHFFFWVAIGFSYDDVSTFSGGPGPVLSAIHILTLGVFAMTIMGAATQLIPVATGLAHRSLWPTQIAWWLFLPGTLIFLTGLNFSEQWIMQLGGLLTAAALLIFGFSIADLLRRSKVLKIPVRFAWLSMASLLVLVLLGLVLLENFIHGFLPDHQAIAASHVILALYGFMGLLLMGFSNILVPMFALSKSPPARNQQIAQWLAPIGLVLAVTGVLVNTEEIVGIAVVIGLIAVILHIQGMLWCLNSGMRKNLGLSFVLVKAGWVMLIVSLIASGLLVFDLLGEQGPAIFGAIVLIGWLATFLLGILQRIVPFLAAMNMSKKTKKPPRLSELGDETKLKLHAVCHGLAFVTITGGIASDKSLPILLGAVIGAVGALFFAWYVVAVARSYMAHHRESEATGPVSGD